MKKNIIKFIFIFILVIYSFIFYSDKIIAKTSNSQKIITINEGEKIQLKVYGNVEKVTWKSFDKNIATVSSKGIVIGKGYGKTTVIGKTKTKSYEYIIKVNSNYEFYFDEESVTLPNDGYSYIGLRVNFIKNGKPTNPPKNFKITSSNKKLYDINTYEKRNSSIIINLSSHKSWEEENVVDSAKICFESEGKKAVCTINVVPASSMSLEDYSVAHNSKYVWQYTDAAYIIDSLNNYDILCGDGTYSIFFRLSTGEEYYGEICMVASNGIAIFSNQFIPKDCDDEDLNKDFISRNYDLRLFYFSDSIISSGTKNHENDTLEEMFNYIPIYVRTGEVDEDGSVIYKKEPNHSSGTISYMRTWTQIDTDDSITSKNYGKIIPKDCGAIIPKDYKITDWGK